jgi:hypothetical protein
MARRAAVAEHGGWAPPRHQAVMRRCGEVAGVPPRSRVVPEGRSRMVVNGDPNRSWK